MRCGLVITGGAQDGGGFGEDVPAHVGHLVRRDPDGFTRKARCLIVAPSVGRCGRHGDARQGLLGGALSRRRFRAQVREVGGLVRAAEGPQDECQPGSRLRDVVGLAVVARERKSRS